MATQYCLIIIRLLFQWLEFHIKINGMTGKQCAFSDQKAGNRSLFSETWARISTSTQWAPCSRNKRNASFVQLDRATVDVSIIECCTV